MLRLSIEPPRRLQRKGSHLLCAGLWFGLGRLSASCGPTIGLPSPRYQHLQVRRWLEPAAAPNLAALPERSLLGAEWRPAACDSRCMTAPILIDTCPPGRLMVANMCAAWRLRLALIPSHHSSSFIVVPAGLRRCPPAVYLSLTWAVVGLDLPTPASTYYRCHFGLRPSGCE